MAKSTKAQDFLKAMQSGPEDPPEQANPGPVPPPVSAPRKAAPASVRKRAELKHFGGYLDDETLEKIALLRVRLKMDNSELIKLAIDELHRKHQAKRAFGDA